MTNFTKMVRRGSGILALMLGVFSAAFGQSGVSGKITDESGQPLPGVSVLVKGSSAGVASDANGNYNVNVAKNGTLVFSYIGYLTAEQAVNGRSSINVSLEPDDKALSEVVVVGYGTQKKVTVTGAVTAVTGEKIVKSPAVDLTNSLAGRLPGLVVLQRSGEPGNDAATIRIRGVNTLGNSSPLIVIDGIPDRDGGMGRLSPRDVESISVLKDASAAIYGARAANGAILITTKRGKTGKPTITYDFNQGVSQPAVLPRMSNAVEYANIMNELPIYKSIPAGEWQSAWNSIKSTGTYDSPTAGVATINANFSPEAVKNYAAGNDPWGYPDTDWFGDAFRRWAPQSRHNLQLVGGTENVKYMTSMGYVFQDAIYKNSATNFSQYNLRSNIDAKLNKYISMNVGFMARRDQSKKPTESVDAIFRMLMRGRPTEPEVWPNGKPGPDIENGQNPYVITTNATGYRDNPTDYLQANGGVDITNPWIKGLKLTLSGAIDKNSSTNKLWQTPWQLYFWDRTSYEADGKTPKLEGSVRSTFKDPRLTQGYSSVLNTNLSGILSYEKVFGNHTLNVMTGVTREEFKGENFFAFRRNYISPAIDQLFAGGSLQQNTGGSAYERARLGYYGRAQYNFKEKYLIEGIWRYDGSYIFPEVGRFGFFPGVLAGWNITNEDFFKVPAIDYMKIRASYGQMGNDQVFFNNRLQEYAFLSTYGLGEYPINSQVVSTLNETSLANPNFTWERANNYNIGIDATLFKSRVDLTLEYFLNRRDQILIQQTGSTPASSGISSLLPPVNAGKVDNRGFEFNVMYNVKPSSDMQLRFGVNGGYAKNKVVFMDEVPGAPDYQRMEGKPIGAYLAFKSAGVFRDAADIDGNKLDYSAVTGRLLPGDMKFEDANGDGKINADDAVRLDKNITPTFNFGSTIDFRYKNFDVNVLFQGAAGALLRIQTESGDIGNFLKYSNDNRWSIENPSSEHPRLASRGDTYFTGGNYGMNTYYLFSKDYIRLKNLEIGYTLPLAVTDRFKISNARVFVNGLNLLTFDKMGVYDPESEVQSGVFYPQSRVINSGITVSF